MPADAGIHLPTVCAPGGLEMDPSFRWGDGGNVIAASPVFAARLVE